MINHPDDEPILYHVEYDEILADFALNYDPDLIECIKTLIDVCKDQFFYS